jgi:hypothetical protein
MTEKANKNDIAWKYAQKAVGWYGWGSPVGIGLLIAAIGASVALLHVAGLFR